MLHIPIRALRRCEEEKTNDVFNKMCVNHYSRRNMPRLFLWITTTESGKAELGIIEKSNVLSIVNNKMLNLIVRFV